MEPLEEHPHPHPDLVMAVYAAFGRSYFFGECLSRELANLCAIIAIPDHKNIISGRYEEEMRRSFALTLGQLIERTRPYLDPKHQAPLAKALADRNHLAHHFWYERAHLMYTEDGLQQMIDELDAMGEAFHQLDRIITEESWPRYEALGLSKQTLEEMTWDVVAGRPYEPLPKQRYPKKVERIVSAWLCKGESTSVIPILQAEDSTLWQLTDVGLGWAPFDVPSADWPPYVALNGSLPADVAPRPSLSAPWSYDLVFSTGCTLSIRRHTSGSLTYKLVSAAPAR